MKMRIFFLLAFFFGCSLIGLSQNFAPMANRNVVWSMKYEGLHDWYTYYFSTDNFNPDTVINSLTYTKVINHFGYQRTYWGAYRSADSGQVFFIPHDSVHEFLIYDFNLNQGDTVRNVYYFQNYFNSQPLDYVVDSTKSIPYFSKDRTVVYLHTADSTTPSRFIYWIEGIGGVGGFTENPTFDYFNFPESLTCISTADTIVYPIESIGDLGTCDTILASYVASEASFFFQVYPNPATEDLNIRCTNHATENFNVYFYDVFGRAVNGVEMLAPVDNIIRYDISDLQKGFYLIRIFFDSYQHSEPLIIE